MPSEQIYKTVHQYSKIPVAEEDMEKLVDIAEDYRKVKNYVYARFGGITGLSKLYPGYTVQNEMTASGYREVLGLPSVYFYLAVFDALGEIKSRWTKTKEQVRRRISKNESFTEDEKHYLYFIVKVNNAFEAVVNQKPVELSVGMRKQYEELAEKTDTDRLHRYLCRQVRKVHGKLHTDKADGFAIAERAYRYGDHGIYISIKEKRKRIFIPLTDNNQYSCQLYVRLYPEKRRVEIRVPVNVAVRHHRDYQKQVGVAAGFYTMFTTDEGRQYGEKLGEYQLAYSEWLRTQAGSYNRNKENNPGRKKYYARKQRMEAGLHDYINRELNRLLREEKPETLYIVKLPKPKPGGKNKKINYSISHWQRGYIRKRLEQKCKEHSVKVVEVMGRDISKECSVCGESGRKEEGQFICPACGYEAEEKLNTARNVKKRGLGDGRLYQETVCQGGASY